MRVDQLITATFSSAVSNTADSVTTVPKQKWKGRKHSANISHGAAITVVTLVTALGLHFPDSVL